METVPQAFGRVPPAHRRAFVTFLMFSDSYLPGCLMAAYGLLRQGSHSDRVCMVTEQVSDRAREALLLLYDRVLPVEEMGVPRDGTAPTLGSPRTGSARVTGAELTRFAALRLGPDGDYGTAYEKVINIDADLLPMRDFEQLWRTPTPAGIINERREHMADIDPQGRLIPRPEALETQEWVWHEIYGDQCPPGAPIPREITDRVAVDVQNYGVNASLLVIEPSMDTYQDFLRWIAEGEAHRLARDRWPWTDQQAATLYWSGAWTSLDPSYSMFYGYPSIDLARGLHYAGVKPWSWRKRGFARRLTRFPDYTLWGQRFLEMVHELPHLRTLGGLRRLERVLRDTLGDEHARHAVHGDRRGR